MVHGADASFLRDFQQFGFGSTAAKRADREGFLDIGEIAPDFGHESRVGQDDCAQGGDEVAVALGPPFAQWFSVNGA